MEPGGAPGKRVRRGHAQPSEDHPWTGHTQRKPGGSSWACWVGTELRARSSHAADTRCPYPVHSRPSVRAPAVFQTVPLPVDPPSVWSAPPASRGRGPSLGCRLQKARGSPSGSCWPSLAPVGTPTWMIQSHSHTCQAGGDVRGHLSPAEAQEGPWRSPLTVLQAWAPHSPAVTSSSLLGVWDPPRLVSTVPLSLTGLQSHTTHTPRDGPGAVFCPPCHFSSGP